MIVRTALLSALTLASLAACESSGEREANSSEGGMERQAASNPAVSAQTTLGLTETQLLQADLVSRDGTDLGDVEQVRRNAGGTVESLLVEIENSDPDRFVLVPMKGLTTRVDGDDTDLQTIMTAAELAAMPDAVTPAR